MSLPYIRFKKVYKKIEDAFLDNIWEYWTAERCGNKDEFTSIIVKREFFDDIKNDEEFSSLKCKYLEELEKIVEYLTKED